MPAPGAEPSRLAGEGQEVFRAAVRAADRGEPALRVAAVEVALDQENGNGGELPSSGGRAVLIRRDLKANAPSLPTFAIIFSNRVAPSAILEEYKYRPEATTPVFSSTILRSILSKIKKSRLKTPGFSSWHLTN
jgi:hypothetical protein